MKIEKINDNQIRCTLTREDLEMRQLKLSELAYGTEKAKNLFREMMRTAAYEYGFEANDFPLMIEAVPVSNESLILLITKVECPEELDTRFSNFNYDEEDSYDEIEDLFDNNYDDENDNYFDKESDTGSNQNLISANDVLNFFAEAASAVASAKAKAEASSDASDDIEISVPENITRLFVFRNLEDIITLSHSLDGYYQGSNSLYKRESDSAYFLMVAKDSHTPSEFNKVCNVLTEYGSQTTLPVGADSYIEEHFHLLIEDDALHNLSQI